MSKTTDSISSTCVLCCGAIEYYALGPCNHHICLKCSTRMRVLCDQKYCSVCRADMPKVIATGKLHPYEGMISHKFPMDRQAGIAFATHKIREEFQRLLTEVCSLCSLRPSEKSFKGLQDHMRKAHELFYCELCIKHLKIFSFERKTYTRKELAVHRRKGDPKDTSYRGHPLCEFCDERYFDNDELLRHLRKQHYFCHFCEKDGVSNEYYNDYDNLKEHFREQHYLCEEERCATEQFTHAFRSSIDLKAHRASVHTSQMSRSQARQMRQLDVEINLPPRQVDRGGGGGGVQGFARGRERRNRDDGLATAVQASMDSRRREVSKRQDTNTDREEREGRRTADRAPSKRQPPPSDRARVGRSKGASATVDEEKVEEGKERRKEAAVATGTASSGAAAEERRGGERSGRGSPPQAEASPEEKSGSEKNPTGGSTERLEANEPPAKEKAKKKKKKNKSKAAPAAETAAPSESAQTQGQTNERPQEPERAPSLPPSNQDYPAVGNNVNPDAKRVQTAWTVAPHRAEDFPTLGASSQPGVSGAERTEGGFDFYTALQKRNAQPKPQAQQPVAQPAQRSFANKDEDFPTLSSIAGILGADSAPSQRGQPLATANSAWVTKDRPKTAKDKPAEPKPAKSKKKNKKAAKENQGASARPEPSLKKPPPGLSMSKQDAAVVSPPGGEKASAKKAPLGPPPGLSLKAPLKPPSEPPLKPKNPPPPNPVSPPPGFGASVLTEKANAHPPPGFGVFIPPAGFQNRNLRLAQQIQALLGDQASRFDLFRSISRQFRDGLMSAAGYYSECQSLLGDNLPKIFDELVVLLPDVLKQQELLAAQNDALNQEKRLKDSGSRGSSAQKSGEAKLASAKAKGPGTTVWKMSTNASCSCPHCGQMLQRWELDGHLNSHQDYPSLSNGAVSSRQPITLPSAWQKIK